MPLTNENNNTTTGPIWSFSTDQNLPVELTSFNAKIVDNKVALGWQTKTETNNYGFEVERSVVMQTSKSGWEKIISPATGPDTKTRFITPSGSPASIRNSMIMRAEYT